MKKIFDCCFRVGLEWAWLSKITPFVFHLAIMAGCDIILLVYLVMTANCKIHSGKVMCSCIVSV